MRLVIQRVSNASVSVHDGTADNSASDATTHGAEETLGSIHHGYVVLVGVAPNDTATDMDWLINKLLTLKLFEDEAGRLKKSIEDIGGELLVVSQFTLYGDVRKGTVPSWSAAAPPDVAEKLYAEFVERLKTATTLTVEQGRFQAHMMVQLVNDGPLTMIVDSPNHGPIV